MDTASLLGVVLFGSLSVMMGFTIGRGLRNFKWDDVVGPLQHKITALRTSLNRRDMMMGVLKKEHKDECDLLKQRIADLTHPNVYR